jgi:hypothetical protein
VVNLTNATAEEKEALDAAVIAEKSGPMVINKEHATD